MVFAPHADDEAIGAGGLLAKVADEGGQSMVVFGHFEVDSQRLAEADASLRVLEVDQERVLTAYSNPAHAVAQVELIVEDWRPTAVILPSPLGFHQDHRELATHILAALRPSGATGKHRPDLIAVYEEPFDNWGVSPVPFNPSAYVTLTAGQLDRKCEAMAAHVSQVRPSPSERSEHALRGMAALRGVQAGTEYAEALEVKYARW
jgi:LmbE family N-acetylglucosaminyl deacetylase